MKANDESRHEVSRTIVAAMTSMALASMAYAEDGKMIELSVKDHKFNPAEPKAAAGSAIVLKIKNLDAAPIEFENLALESIWWSGRTSNSWSR